MQSENMKMKICRPRVTDNKDDNGNESNEYTLTRRSL